MGEEAITAALDRALSSVAIPPQASGLGRDLVAARRVIRAEIEGLEQLSKTLDSAFSVAIDLCAAARGRLIVTGIGKSGHVARKIAATLASTGTPTQFVHPAEASHGDLGMIGVDDAILALSNSGESDEMADIIAYSRRNSTGRGSRRRRRSSRDRRGWPRRDGQIASACRSKRASPRSCGRRARSCRSR